MEDKKNRILKKVFPEKFEREEKLQTLSKENLTSKVYDEELLTPEELSKTVKTISMNIDIIGKAVFYLTEEMKTTKAKIAQIEEKLAAISNSGSDRFITVQQLEKITEKLSEGIVELIDTEIAKLKSAPITDDRNASIKEITDTIEMMMRDHFELKMKVLKIEEIILNIFSQVEKNLSKENKNSETSPEQENNQQS